MKTTVKQKKSNRVAKKAVSKASQVSVTTAKKKAWKVFSEYIRRKYANAHGIVKCVTCSWFGHWTEAQAGHFIDGRNNSVLYRESLVHPQCYACNIFKHGNKVKYTVFMAQKYCLTLKDIDELEQLRHQTLPMKAHDHIAVFEKYSQLLRGMNEQSTKVAS